MATSDLGALQVRTLLDAAVEHLQGEAPALNVFDAAVAHAPTDSDGKAHAFAVLYPMPGQATQDRLTARLDGLVWQFQATCAGGDVVRALASLDAVRAAFVGRKIPIPGGAMGRCREIGGSGPITEEREASPSRFSAALILSVHVTRRSP